MRLFRLLLRQDIRSVDRRIMYVRTSPAEKFLVSLFSKSAEPTANQRTHIARPKPSGALYILQRAIKESFGQAFSKACGVKRGRAPENSVFFLRSFFFCAYATKRKSERMKVDVVRVQRTMYAQIVKIM